jgi:tetratricopeptide (TPR) repeat protein
MDRMTNRTDSRARRWTAAAPVVAVAAAAVALTAAPLAAQVGAGMAPAKLELTTASAEARSAFTTGVEDFGNSFAARGATRLERALELDPSFGLARVIRGVLAPGLTADQRNEEITRGMSDATKATAGELLVASAYRESFRQNAAGARAILAAAITMMPGEPSIAFRRAMLAPNLPGGVFTDVIAPLRQVIERFPDYAPAYNVLAYAQWEAGTPAEAMRTATTYMQKAPNHPKSHDTYAELLQWDGRYEEAIPHYTRARELDPTFVQAVWGLSEVYALQGKGDMARQTITAAIPTFTVPAQVVNAHARIGNSYVLEGNTKAALAAFGTMIAEAKKANLPGPEAQAHIAMMNIEAAFGDPKNVAAHVGHLAAMSPAPPVLTANPANRFVSQGTIYALGGQPAQARVYLDSLTQRAQTTPSDAITAQRHQLTGWVLYSEGKFTDALAEFRQANQQNVTVRSGIALTLFKLGNVAEARTLRDELANDRDLNLANGPSITARRLVKQRIT